MAAKRAKGALPNMGRLDDVADYLLDPSGAGFTSASESEVDTDAEVEVMETSARKVLNRRDKQRQRDTQRAAAEDAEHENGAISGKNAEGRVNRSATQKRAVRLTELGPRMRLRLVKVEEGLCGGKVMWHEFINKTEAEQREMDKVWDQRKKEKAERKRIQKENLEKKKKTKGEKAGGEEGDDAENGEDDDMDDDEWDEDDGEDEDEDEMEVEGGEEMEEEEEEEE